MSRLTVLNRLSESHVKVTDSDNSPPFLRFAILEIWLGRL